MKVKEDFEVMNNALKSNLKGKFKNNLSMQSPISINSKAPKSPRYKMEKKVAGKLSQNLRRNMNTKSVSKSVIQADLKQIIKEGK